MAKLRLTLLRLTCLSIFIGFSKLLLDPVAGQRPFARFDFPKTVSISGWQLVESQPLGDRRSDSLQYDWVVAGQHYRYQKMGTDTRQPLNIEIRYVVNTNGNTSQWMKEQKAIAIDTAAHQVKTDLGIYSRFTVDGQTHLTSCINPRGSSTVTSEQFLYNRYTYDRQLDHLLSWSLGRNDLLDKRCLWIALSLPANVQMSEPVGADLEMVWRNQVMTWRSQFPNP